MNAPYFVSSSSCNLDLKRLNVTPSLNFGGMYSSGGPPYTSISLSLLGCFVVAYSYIFVVVDNDDATFILGIIDDTAVNASHQLSEPTTQQWNSIDDAYILTMLCLFLISYGNFRVSEIVTIG